MLDSQTNRLLHGLLNELEIDAQGKLERVSYWTNARTTSSAEMDVIEAKKLISDLQTQVSQRKKDLMRKAVRLLDVLGYKLPSGGMDWPRINAYIKGIGSRNPRKVPLNWLRANELRAVVQQLQQRATAEAKKQAA